MCDLTFIGCRAHPRRCFNEVLAKTRLVAGFFRQIGQLYALETQLSGDQSKEKSLAEAARKCRIAGELDLETSV
jgi:hypothetical protein